MKNKSLIVAKYEFLKTARKKSFLLTAVAMPLLIALPLFLIMNYFPILASQNSNETIGFADYAGFLEAGRNFVKYADAQSAKQALMGGEISSFFVVPQDYFNTGKITVYSKSTGSLFSSAPARTDAFLKENLLRHGNVSPEIAARLENPVAAEPVTLDSAGNAKAGKENIGSILLPYAFAILLSLSIMTSSRYLMEGIAEEKEARTGELLLSSISSDQLLNGKILGYGGIGLLQIVIWIAVGMAIITIGTPFAAGLFSGIGISYIFGLAVIYFILGYFLFAVSVACAAAISPTAKDAQQVSSLFTMFAILPVAFGQFIIRMPDSAIAKALTYFPYTSPFITMMRLPLVEVPPYEIAASIAILIISIVILAKLSGKIFRMGMLMYGKRANLKDIIRFLREK